MGDDFNFFLPDELLNDSDSDGENVGDALPGGPGAASLQAGSGLPAGFVSSTSTPDFPDSGTGYPAQSRLLSGIANANQGLANRASSHR